MINTRLKKESFIIFIFLTVNLTLHLIADLHSGFHGDELYYIDSGRHPALGFMDFPPMISWLAYIQNLFQSTSLLLNHLFVYTASALIFIFAGLTTIKAGGKWLAVLTALSCILFSPGFGATHSLFLPDIFEQLANVLTIYFLTVYCKIRKNKYLVLIAIVSAFGFLTKYSTGFLITALFFSVLVIQPNLLKNRMLWLSVVIFLMLISPNIIWQFRNHFPFLNHFSTLYSTQLNHLTRIAEIRTLIVFLNPLTSIIWVTGLILIPFTKSFKKFRLVTYTLIISFLLILIADGKSYYYYPLILGALPMGAVFLERIFQNRKWMLISYISLTCLFGIVSLPKGMTILPLKKYISIYHLKKNNDGKIPLPLENYYSKNQWNKLLLLVDSTYRSLPPLERKSTLIWGRHYSQSGIINLFKKKYGLPAAFSFHGSCYSWVPDFSKNITVIGISEANLGTNFWLHYFQEVREIGDIENPYADNPHWYKQRVFLCKKPIYNSDELKSTFKDQIF